MPQILAPSSLEFALQRLKTLLATPPAIPPASKLAGILAGFYDAGWLFDVYSLESVRQALAENPDSPDLKWWIVTLQGEVALVSQIQAIKTAKQAVEKQSRGLGFARR